MFYFVVSARELSHELAELLFQILMETFEHDITKRLPSDHAVENLIASSSTFILYAIR